MIRFHKCVRSLRHTNEMDNHDAEDVPSCGINALIDKIQKILVPGFQMGL